MICKVGVGGKPDVLVGIAADININEECSKYGIGKPGVFTSIPKMRKWIDDTLKELNERSNDGKINRPIFFVVILFMIISQLPMHTHLSPKF